MTAEPATALRPAAAALRGHDYQHAIAWLWVCRMLRSPARIRSVTVEDPAGGAFDDIVVRRGDGPDIYIQAKTSNRGDKPIDADWLLAPQPGNASSPLQCFHATFRSIRESDSLFVLELWTTRAFDPKNPILGKLRDAKHSRIDTSKMLAAPPGSVIGKERQRWADHLGATAEELAEFLDAVRWKNPGSEMDIRAQAQDCMTAAGLRHDKPAVDLGVTIVREWVTDAKGEMDAEAAGRQAADKRLAGPSEAHMQAAAADRSLGHLPPACRSHIEALQESDPETAGRVVALLGQRSSRTPGVLAHLAEDPPMWLRDANVSAWETITEFMRSHGLPGVGPARERAIRSGSHRSDFHRVRDALQAVDEGHRDHAEVLLRDVAEGHPLLEAARAALAEDATAAVAAVRAAKADQSTDPDAAITAVGILAWAYHVVLNRTEDAIRAAENACRRFPKRADAHLMLAQLRLASARQREGQGVEASGQYKEAARAAVEARDLFHSWEGPSAPAVAVATEALLRLDEHQQVIDLASPAPQGQATVPESECADVAKNRLYALLMLGPGEELDGMDPDLLAPNESRLLAAVQARRRNDPAAVEWARAAVEQARGDREILTSLMWLARFGEVDETAIGRLASTAPSEASGVRAFAAFHRGDYESVLTLLAPHGSVSDVHAELLAAAHRALGATEDAIDTLLQAAQTRGAVRLYPDAVAMIVAAGDLPRAEAVALAALAGSLPGAVDLRLRRLLADIAQKSEDWAQAERYVRKILDAYPEETQAVWALVASHINRGDAESAWRVITEFDAAPHDTHTARCVALAYPTDDATPDDTERLLEVADRFAHDEEVAGTALMALMVKGGDSRIDDAQRKQFAAALERYTTEHEQSQVLRRFECSSTEDVIEMLKASLPVPTAQQRRACGLVRLGQAPYGILQAARPVPYAELLASLAVGNLTAVSCDPETRAREREAASESLGGAVTADSSVAAFAAHAGIDPNSAAANFKRVLVADELVTDARNADRCASVPTAGTAALDPADGGVRLTGGENHAAHTERVRGIADRMVRTLESWRSIPSGGIEAPWADQDEDESLRPWDASLRVALNQRCALWCDDVAVRGWAENEGIRTFGTYALLEALDADADTAPRSLSTDLKGRMLRAGIADIPLTWEEITAIADADTSGAAAYHFLCRPASWSQMQPSLKWCLDRLKAAASADVGLMCSLVWAASYGLGSATSPDVRRHMMGCFLAMAVPMVRHPETMQGLVDASRQACLDISPEGDLDVLDVAAEALMNVHMAAQGPTQAARSVVRLFAGCGDSDRRAVASAILAARAEPGRTTLPAPADPRRSLPGRPAARVRTLSPTLADARRAADALREIGARKVMLFGSVADGIPAPESDIDLVAVFDDLGDYSDRHGIETRAQAAAEGASGRDCDVLVTDRAEWATRSKLATTVESEIARSARTLLDLPAAQRIRWDKQLVRPSTDTQEATQELHAAVRHLRAVRSCVLGSRNAQGPLRESDPARAEISRYDRMRMLCEDSHKAVSAALRAYTKGVMRRRPKRRQDAGRVTAMLESMPAADRLRAERAFRARPELVDLWEQKPGGQLPTEALRSVTPQLAADMAITALDCCELAARAVADACGSSPATRELLEIATGTDTGRAAIALRKEPPIHDAAYEVNGLVPPERGHAKQTRRLRTSHRRHMTSR